MAPPAPHAVRAGQCFSAWQGAAVSIAEVLMQWPRGSYSPMSRAMLS